MNEKEFRRYIGETRDCDPALLDFAVRKGLNKGKDERPDYRKLLLLAAACAVSAMLCVMLTSQSVGTALRSLVLDSELMTQSGSEALHKHLIDYLNGFIILFGG